MPPSFVVLHWNELTALVLCIGLFSFAMGMLFAAEVEDDHSEGPPGVHA